MALRQDLAKILAKNPSDALHVPSHPRVPCIHRQWSGQRVNHEPARRPALSGTLVALERQLSDCGERDLASAVRKSLLSAPAQDTVASIDHEGGSLLRCDQCQAEHAEERRPARGRAIADWREPDSNRAEDAEHEQDGEEPVNVGDDEIAGSVTQCLHDLYSLRSALIGRFHLERGNRRTESRICKRTGQTVGVDEDTLGRAPRCDQRQTTRRDATLEQPLAFAEHHRSDPETIFVDEVGAD